MLDQGVTPKLSGIFGCSSLLAIGIRVMVLHNDERLGGSIDFAGVNRELDFCIEDAITRTSGLPFQSKLRVNGGYFT